MSSFSHLFKVYLNFTFNIVLYSLQPYFIYKIILWFSVLKMFQFLFSHLSWVLSKTIFCFVCTLLWFTAQLLYLKCLLLISAKIFPLDYNTSYMLLCFLLSQVNIMVWKTQWTLPSTRLDWLWIAQSTFRVSIFPLTRVKHVSV